MSAGVVEMADDGAEGAVVGVDLNTSKYDLMISKGCDQPSIKYISISNWSIEERTYITIDWICFFLNKKKTLWIF